MITDIKYEIIRKKVKNLSIKIESDKTVKITAPLHLSNSSIKEVISRKETWIKKKINEIERRENYFEKLKNTINGESILLLGRYLEVIYEEANIDLAEITHDKVIVFHNKLPKEKVLENFIDKYRYQVYVNRLEELRKMMSSDIRNIPELQIRKMKRSYGICKVNQNIVVLNKQLIHVPIECLDYIIIHELSHFKFPNHSQSFYNLVAKYCPNYKQLTSLINKYTTVINM